MSEWSDQRKLQAAHGAPMSDRTQTLSVELDHDVASALLNGTALNMGYHHARVAMRKAIRTALSQPEHQGDEEAKQQAASMERDLALIRDEPVTGAEVEWIAWAREAAATCLSQLQRDRGYLRYPSRGPEAASPVIRRHRPTAQPPAPALSDEERERLETAAKQLTADMLDADMCGEPNSAEARRASATFLRNLASREHQGEDEKQEQIEALEEKLGDAEAELDKWESVLVAADRVHEAYAAALSGRDLGGLPPWTKGDLQFSDDRKNAAPQPPAGEVGRLREPVSADEVRGILKGCPTPEEEQAATLAAEAVLEELVAEFEQEAEAIEDKGSPMGEHLRSEEGEVEALRRAASLVRGKAAKLKDGAA